jgi:hypothetical protein
MATAYELWLADKKRREQEAAQNAQTGQVNFKEASAGSRPQYSLPGYQGDSQKDNVTYQWEKDILGGIKSSKEIGKSNNDKFNYVTKQLGMTPGQADDFRTFLDFQEDSKQEYKLNTRRLSLPRPIDSPWLIGPWYAMKSDVLKGIFNNYNQNLAQDIQSRAKTIKKLVPSNNGRFNNC